MRTRVKLSPDELLSPIMPKAEKGPAAQNALSENMARDISDEFHERFQKAANEDTSETLIKSSLEATRMADGKNLGFPLDREDEIFAAGLGRVADTLTEFETVIPQKTMFSEKDEIFDFGPASQKQNKEKGPETRVEKLFDEELFVQKVRPEVISPEAELAKLSTAPQKETKTAPQIEGGLTLREKMDLTGKLEDKLTLTIKELIWEIVPSLAEKIIKEEIDKIKSEANDTGF